MKNSLLLVSSLLVLSVLFAFSYKHATSDDKKITANNVNWMSWQEAMSAANTAKKEGKTPKMIFVDIYTDWCGWCKKMDKETFQQPAIADYLNKHFYPVKFNAEQKESIDFSGNTFKYVPNGRRGYHELAAALLNGKMSYPTVVFLNEDFQLLQRVPGYLDIPTFNMIMHYLAEKHYLKTPWSDYQKKFQK